LRDGTSSFPVFPYHSPAADPESISTALFVIVGLDPTIHYISFVAPTN